MKIKSDFVTNSSSNCYIVIDTSKNGLCEPIEKLLKECTSQLEYADSAGIDATLSCLDELNEYTNDGPLDWVQKAVGPNMWNLGQEEYDVCKKALISSGSTVHIISFDRAMDLTSDLETLGLDVVRVFYN
jgi:hypothetical protein